MPIPPEPQPPAAVMPSSTVPTPAASLALTFNDSTPSRPDTKGYRPVSLRASTVGHFHVAGRLNGKEVEVLIDTGASGTVVDRGWAEGEGLRLVELGRTGGGVGGATMSVARVEESSLAIGGVELPGVQLAAIDLGSVIAQLKARGATPPQVVVGVDVLRRWRAVIDYGTSTLWLAPVPH